MGQFKAVEISDKPLFDSFVANSDIEDCNYSFYNLFAWDRSIPKRWLVESSMLLTGYFGASSDRLCLMLPVGNGSLADKVAVALEQARRQGMKLELSGLSEQQTEQIGELYGDRFAFSFDRNMSDYLYRADDLVNLHGSHYQPKRNLINQFVSLYPDWHYEPLTDDNRSLYFAFDRDWELNRDAEGETITDEELAIRLGLCNMDALGLFGGLLYVDDRVVGCSYGSKLTNRVVCKHFNKADVAFHGSYAMLERCFVEHLPEGVELVNFEEDLGIDGLRRAKLAYQPVKVLDKWTAREI